ncbi:helical backbone metal receptor [Rhodohalobacter halophilus]|uniref:helical backbone metal receptor n=1 Tax=Rhodohalobacter halophilus TaxID=1812810 RepID=UPI00083F6B4A|nr:helical backbone metal receptor [Rhodohalobacter halophilus]
MESPQKIISLVPSLTELLFDLNLDERIIGRTRFCIHPKERVKNVEIMGGTKNPRLDKIRNAQPDLIIANKEENRKEDIEKLQSDFEVMVTDINTIEDAFLTIHDIGGRCNAEETAQELISAIRNEYDRAPDESPMSVTYMIWRDPWMTVGSNTYIHSVLSHWKLDNLFENQSRYPTTTLEELSRIKPDIILLSSEPYPFKEKHIKEVENACPKSRVLLVDGEWFSWYGSRMLPSFKKLNAFRKAIS